MIERNTSYDLNSMIGNPVYGDAQGLSRSMVENLGLVPISPTSGFISTSIGGTGSANFSNNSTGDTTGNSQTLRLRVTAATTTGNYAYADMVCEGEIVGVILRSDSQPATLWVDKECFRVDCSQLSTHASLAGWGFPSNSLHFIPRDRWGNPILFHKRPKLVRLSVACDASSTQDGNLLAFLVTREYGRQLALQSNINPATGLLTTSLASISTSNLKGHNFVTYYNTDTSARYVTIADSSGNTIQEIFLAATTTAPTVGGYTSSVIFPLSYGGVGGTRAGLQHKADSASKVRWATFGVAGGVG